MSSKNNSGFTLPAPGESTPASSTSSSVGVEPVQMSADTLVRDISIAAGIMLVLMVVFFFIKNAFAQSLVAKKRFSPIDAGTAGWWLFSFLFFASLFVVLMVVNPVVFMLPKVMVVMAIMILISLVQTWRTSRA